MLQCWYHYPLIVIKIPSYHAVHTPTGGCGDLATISPQRLVLQRWSPATLQCTYRGPCLQIETWLLFRGGLNSTQSETNVLRDPTLSPVVTRIQNISNGENCSLEVDFSWSGDEDIRRQLQSRNVHFLLVVNGTTCRTENTTVDFSSEYIELLPNSISCMPTTSGDSFRPLLDLCSKRITVTCQVSIIK